MFDIFGKEAPFPCELKSAVNACDIKLEVCGSPKRQSFRWIGAFSQAVNGTSKGT